MNSFSLKFSSVKGNSDAFMQFKLKTDLNSIFKFIEKLNELDTSKTEALSSIVESKLQLRKDEIKSKDIREQILKNSPSENKDFFVVPKVVE